MAETPTPTPSTTDELKTCAGCKKPMKRIVKYYRNGKYYCNKNCWKKVLAAPAA